MTPAPSFALSVPLIGRALSTSSTRLEKYGPGLLAGMMARQISTPLRAAHFLAQIGHESGGLHYSEEIASGKAYENRADLGNTEPGDGPRFKGRGLIQLTGRANYARYASDKGRPAILTNPSIVATEPALCTDVACWYWEMKNLNALADEDSLVKITRRVNGGLNGFLDRQRRLVVAKSAFGIS